jgi:ribonuclease-3
MELPSVGGKIGRIVKGEPLKRRAHNPVDAEPSLPALEQRLGHSFARPDLLLLALTHRSFVYDTGGATSDADKAARSNPALDNEQLEFMGDAALGLLVAESLCRRFPASREGDLTRMRAALVSRKHLGEVGTRLELGRWLRLGPTTEEAGGRENAGLVSNATEAIIAALYLDGGLEAARQFIEREILGLIDLDAAAESFPASSRDHKTALQELTQARGLGRPHYIPLAESGPAHRRTFHMQVALLGPGADLGPLSEAEGPTKKQAQQEAARLAVARLAELGHATAIGQTA